MLRLKTVPQKVRFYSNVADLLCITLAFAGQSNKAIIHALRNSGLDLTEGQINYRIGLYERKRRAGALTQRAMFRNGVSPVAQALVSQIMGNRGIGQLVKNTAVSELEKKHLYNAPQVKGNGVMRDEPGLRRKSA